MMISMQLLLGRKLKLYIPMVFGIEGAWLGDYNFETGKWVELMHFNEDNETTEVNFPDDEVRVATELELANCRSIFSSLSYIILVYNDGNLLYLFRDSSTLLIFHFIFIINLYNSLSLGCPGQRSYIKLLVMMNIIFGHAVLP